MTNIKAKLAELLSPLGAGNNAYELGQLAQRQAELIEVLVSDLNKMQNQNTNPYGLAKHALQKAKEAGYL